MPKYNGPLRHPLPKAIKAGDWAARLTIRGSAGMEEIAQLLGMILGGLFTWSLVLNALAF
jgi:hypothetical protein